MGFWCACGWKWVKQWEVVSAWFQLGLTCPELKELSHGGWWSSHGSPTTNEVATTRLYTSWKMANNNSNQPRGGKLGVSPNWAEQGRSLDGVEVVRSMARVRAGRATRGWFRATSAPFDADSEWERSSRKLSKVVMSSPSSEVVRTAGSDSEQGWRVCRVRMREKTGKERKYEENNDIFILFFLVIKVV